MSPNKQHKLNKLRVKLDKVDDQLLKLFKNRTELVKKVLALKKYKNQIIDKKRIKKILSNIKRKSQQRNLDKKITNEIWTAMIRAYIKYEYKNFKK